MTNDADTAARALAQWLAPYVAEELGLTRPPQPQLSLESYDEGTCAVVVAPLGDVVLDNAEVFFTRLADEGEIGSLALARSRARPLSAENQLRSPAFSTFSIRSLADPSPRSRSHS